MIRRIPLLGYAVLGCGATLLMMLSAILVSAPALAQAPCRYATLRIETVQPVDPQAICEAARPLAEKNLRILVYLTDQRTPSEDAWFELIDAVESAEGFRDPNRADIYALTGITLAASTNTSTLWGINATFGERLFDSRADRQFDQIRTQIRPFLAAGQPTDAVVTGLTTIYAFNFPPSPLRNLVPIGGAGLAGGGGWLVWNRRKKRQRLIEQITRLQTLVSTLMLACDELLPAGDPTQAMYYQLFGVMGGEEAKGLAQQLRQWLVQARSALDKAYTIQAHLNTQSETLNRDTLAQLEGLVKSWEALYRSVIGSREEILSLSEDQLRTLLSPLNYLPARGSYGALEQKLERLQQHLQSTPLKINLMYPLDFEDEEDEEASILSVIYQIDTLLDRVSQAETVAPTAVATLGSQRNSLARQIPAEFPYNIQTIFQKVDDRIQLAQKAIERGRWMLALDACDSAQQGLEGSAVLVDAATLWAGTNRILEQYRFEGYRLDGIPASRAAEQGQDRIGGLIAAGQLQDLPATARIWSGAIRTLREEAQSLVSLHKSNLDALTKIKAAVSNLDNRWQVLARSIHRGDRDLNAAYEQIEALKTDRIPAVEHLNSLQVQDFRSAQTLLAEAEDVIQIARNSILTLERRFNNNSDYDTYYTSDSYSRKRRPVVVYTNTSSNTAWKRRQGSSPSAPSQRPANSDWKRNAGSSRPSPPPPRSSGGSSSGGSSSRGSSGGGSSDRSSSGGGSSRRR